MSVAVPQAGGGTHPTTSAGRGPAVRRGFLRVGHGRHVHYRCAGEGPPLLLLHQSPQNSRMWADMIRRFATRYTVIAPDTPGFGYSDPLDVAEPGIAELAAATMDVVDALGLERFAVHGMHTGGLIAAWLASEHPGRVVALMVDGYAAFEPVERAIYGDRYLPPFIPTWEGAHLRWLWARMREQKYFFPWYDGRRDCAMTIDPHTTASTHEAVMDVLEVGDVYRAGYGAAFRQVAHDYLSRLRVPGLLVYRREDPLRAHASRLPGLPAHIQVIHEDGGTAGLSARMGRFLGSTLGHEAAARTLAAPDVPAGWRRCIIESPVGEIACWRRPGAGGLRLVLHAPGTRPLRPAQLGGAGNEAMVAPDLPGHGASAEIEAEPGIDTLIAAVGACVAVGGGDLPITLETHGAAAGYVPALAMSLGSRLRRVVLHAPWLLEAGEREHLLAHLPDLQPRRAGGHLDEAWQWERERHLLWPWLPPAAGARREVAAPEPGDVHANVVELLRLGGSCQRVFAEALPVDLIDRLACLPVPLQVRASPEDDYRGRAAALMTRHEKEHKHP